MKATTATDVALFKEHGQLTEEQLDNSKIATIPNDKAIPRDQRPLQNQRAVLVSHKETLERFVTYENRGLEIGQAILQTASGKERKEYRVARNIVAKHQNREKKKKENQEKNSQLTPEQKKQQAAVRQANTAAKKAKEKAEYESALAFIQSRM